MNLYPESRIARGERQEAHDGGQPGVHSLDTGGGKCSTHLSHSPAGLLVGLYGFRIDPNFLSSSSFSARSAPTLSVL